MTPGKFEWLLTIAGAFLFWGGIALLFLIIASCAAPPSPGEPGFARYQAVAQARQACQDHYHEIERKEPRRYELRPGGYSIQEYCRRKYK